MSEQRSQERSAPLRKVIRADQSPVNFRRWNIWLACGHDLWVTRVSRPTVKTAKCERCKSERK